MTEDELFVTADAAAAGVRIVDLSESEPLVMLKHFGPGNPDNPIALTQRRRDAENILMADTPRPAFHNAMWPGLVGKGGPTPSRRSTWTRCST